MGGGDAALYGTRDARRHAETAEHAHLWDRRLAARPWGVGLSSQPRWARMAPMNRLIHGLMAALLAAQVAGAAAGEQMLAEGSNIFAHATAVSYRHLNAPGSAQLRCTPQGDWISSNDCSGFVSFMVHSVAPRAYAAVQAGETKYKHVRAVTYAKFFQGLETNRTATGWQRVATWRDLRPGDVIAWSSLPRTNSEHQVKSAGHVALVAQLPTGPREEMVDGKSYRCISVQVLDSSSVRHFPPETYPPRVGQTDRNGLGFGFVRLLLDERDQACGYWEGTWWGEGQTAIRRPTHTTILGFARLADE